MCYRQSGRGVARQNSEKCKTIVCIANTFTHRRFYTQKLLHTEAFTQRLLHTKLLPTEALHTDAFTHRCFYTQTLLHGHFYTQTRLHTDTFTHRPFYTQELLLHTNAKRFDTHENQSVCDKDKFWSVFTNENLRVLIKTNVWHGISWISKMWLCRSMMVTCLHGARLSDSSGWNGPLNPLNVKIPLQLELKPWQNLLSRTLRRHQNEIVVMPSKNVVKWRRMKW